MKKIETNEFFDRVYAVLNGIDDCYGYYCIQDKEILNYGVAKDYDAEFCKSNNIPTVYSYRSGGSILGQIGDFNMYYVSKTLELQPMTQIFDTLLCVLHHFNLNANLDGNDLMINGYKVASYSVENLENGDLFTACQISRTVNLDHIKNACTKEMKKIPAGLEDFGVNCNIVFSMITDIAKNINIEGD